MAFNNYFPQYYPNQMPMVQTAQQMPIQQPAVPQNAQQVSGNGINWVLGEAAAKAYPVGAGQAVPLMDREEPVLYIKSTDMNGMPQPLEIYDLIKRTPGRSTSTSSDDFVSRKEFDEFREDVKRSIKGIRKPRVQEDEE